MRTFELEGLHIPGSPNLRGLAMLAIYPLVLVFLLALFSFGLAAKIVVGVLVVVFFVAILRYEGRYDVVRIVVADQVSIDGRVLSPSEVRAVREYPLSNGTSRLIAPLALSIRTADGVYTLAARTRTSNLHLERSFAYRNVDFLSDEDFAELEGIVEERFGPIKKLSW